MHAYADDAEVGRYLVRGAEQLRAEPELALAEAERVPRTEYGLAVVRRPSGEVIGSAEVYVESMRHHRAEIGYVLRRDMWGQGLATEVAALLLRFSFADLGLHRVFATCDPANRASVRVLEKIGMRCEGNLLHQLLADDGSWRDALVYAAVAPDPGAMSARRPPTTR